MTHAEERLRQLVWEVTDLQTKLIKLGDDTVRQIASFGSWLRSRVLGQRLPFRELKERSDELATEFKMEALRLARFEAEDQLTESGQACFERLRRFSGLLEESAAILNRNHATALEGAEGVRRVTLAEIQTGSTRFNNSMSAYMEAAADLQPYITRLFEGRDT